MSRVGKVPVSIPQGVQIEFKDEVILIKGKLGELTVPFNAYVRGLVSVVLNEAKTELVLPRLKFLAKNSVALVRCGVRCSAVCAIALLVWCKVFLSALKSTALVFAPKSRVPS